MKLTVFIADDEAFARDEVKHLLSMHPECVIVGEASSGVEAVQKIKELKPEVLFLDIEMPGLKGLDVAGVVNSIEGYKPYTIIITAYDNFALTAYEQNVMDYLLKPIDPKRFSMAVGKVMSYSKVSLAGKIERIVAKSGNKVVLIPQNEISFICMDETVVYINCGDAAYTTTYRTLEELESELDKTIFFKTHRAYIVNIKKIREIKQTSSGTLNLKLEDVTSKEVPVSRNNVKELKGIFKF